MFLRDLGLRISYNASQANSALTETNRHVDKVKFNAESMQKTFDRVGRSMGRIGGYMTTRVTLPLIGIAGASLKAASDFEEMQSKFNVVFGELATSTTEWAEEYGKSVGRSRSVVMGYMAETQNMLVGMGATRQEGQELSKQITQLAVDLASFNNVAESDALNSLQSAMIGNHMAARSLGAVINDNTLQTAMERMQIQGKFQDLDELQKMQVRYTAVLMQSEDAIGDAERTSGSFKNQMVTLRQELGELGITIGTILLPYGTELLGWGTRAVSAFSGLNQETQEMIIAGAAMVAALGPLALVIKTVSIVGGTAIKMFTLLKGATLAAIIAKGSLVAALGPPAIAIAALATAVYGLYKNYDLVIGKAKEFIETLRSVREWTGGFGISGGAGFGGITENVRQHTPAGVERDRAAVSNSTSNYQPNVNVTINNQAGPTLDNSAQLRRVVDDVLSDNYRRSANSLALSTLR